MSRRIITLLFVSLFISFNLSAQDATAFHTKAKQFMMQAHLDSATFYLNKALQLSPQNLEMLEDQVYLEQLKRDYVKSLQLGKLLVERQDAGVKTFQLVGLTYKAIADYKEAKKLYDRALLKFPNSGVLYNEYGDLYSQMNKSSDAIKQWEKGIEVDPGYGNNYYYAAKYYTEHKNPLWAMLYGESFVNIESYSERTNEIKIILTELYKRVSAPGFIKADRDNPFTSAVAATLARQSPIAFNNVTVESLTALRTSFIKDWYIINSSKFPYKLFEYQDQLVKEGLFDAYNQWLFGTSVNETAYNNWTAANKAKMEAFKKFQGGRVFKVPAGQYYQSK